MVVFLIILFLILVFWSSSVKRLFKEDSFYLPLWCSLLPEGLVLLWVYGGLFNPRSRFGLFWPEDPPCGWTHLLPGWRFGGQLSCSVTRGKIPGRLYLGYLTSPWNGQLQDSVQLPVKRIQLFLKSESLLGADLWELTNAGGGRGRGKRRENSVTPKSKEKESKPVLCRLRDGAKQRKECVCGDMSRATKVAIRGHPFQTGRAGRESSGTQSSPCFSLWNGGKEQPLQQASLAVPPPASHAISLSPLGTLSLIPSICKAEALEVLFPWVLMGLNGIIHYTNKNIKHLPGT